MSLDAPTRIEDVLLAVTRIGTYLGDRSLTGASGFFFRREDRLFVVTNRHVLHDEASEHFPDRIEILVHTDERNLRSHAVLSLPLYRDGLALWRAATDSEGPVDVAVVQVHGSPMPLGENIVAFDPSHLDARGDEIAIGDALSVLGFPLGFHDTVHHLAVSRSASIASAYGVRFQGQGYFLTDARTHRGSSGSAVLRRRSTASRSSPALPWQLLGVHSTRMDMNTRDAALDESLGLNCAWYADVLMELTK